MSIPTLCTLIVVTFVFAHSFHIDWCSRHAECAHTEDICKDAHGSSMTHLFNDFILADPDNCARCFLMRLARGCAWLCSFVPLRSQVLGLVS